MEWIICNFFIVEIRCTFGEKQVNPKKHLYYHLRLDSSMGSKRPIPTLRKLAVLSPNKFKTPVQGDIKSNNHYSPKDLCSFKNCCELFSLAVEKHFLDSLAY